MEDLDILVVHDENGLELLEHGREFTADNQHRGRKERVDDVFGKRRDTRCCKDVAEDELDECLARP